MMIDKLLSMAAPLESLMPDVIDEISFNNPTRCSQESHKAVAVDGDWIAREGHCQVCIKKHELLREEFGTDWSSDWRFPTDNLDFYWKGEHFGSRAGWSNKFWFNPGVRESFQKSPVGVRIMDKMIELHAMAGNER